MTEAKQLYRPDMGTREQARPQGDKLQDRKSAETLEIEREDDEGGGQPQGMRPPNDWRDKGH